MEKKNTVLLTVIAVATLLVAVVGATFAYFTATSGNSGAGTGATTANTASVADSAELSTVTGKSSDTYYPGTINYASATVSVKKTTSASTSALDVDYSITASVNVGDLTNVEWALYKSTTEINPVIKADSCGASAHTTSDAAHTIPAGQTWYYQTCKVDDAFSSLTPVLTSETADVDPSNISASGTLTTATDETAGETVYYYLVVTYKDDGVQNTEQGKPITFQLNAATSTATRTHTGA